MRGGGTVTTSGEGGDVRCTHGARSKAAAAAPQRRGARRRRTSGCVETQRLAPRDLATPQRCGRRPLPPPLSQLARWDAAYLRLLGCCVRGSVPAAAGAQQCLNVDCREQRNRGYVAATVLVSVATAGCDLPSGKVLEEWLFEYKQCACDSNEMPSMVQAYNLMERVQALGHTTLRRHHKLTGSKSGKQGSKDGADRINSEKTMSESMRDKICSGVRPAAQTNTPPPSPSHPFHVP